MRQMWLVSTSQPDNKPHLDLTDVESDQFTRPDAPNTAIGWDEGSGMNKGVLKIFRSSRALADLIRSALGAEPSHYRIACCFLCV